MVNVETNLYADVFRTRIQQEQGPQGLLRHKLCVCVCKVKKTEIGRLSERIKTRRT